jgi:molybdenum cofactor synthesis domain-containing protein
MFLTFKYVWYNNSMFAAGILIVSDKGFRGERNDESGVVVREFLSKIPACEAEYAVVPDEKGVIASELRKWVDDKGLDIIFTSGGTGLSARDVTPEATMSIIDKVVPGLVEAMRMRTMKKTEEAILSRAVAGIRGKCLIINFPGSPRGVRECLEVIMPVLSHALDIISGRILEHSHGYGVS